MELENLIAKKETDKRLQERQLELEQEREEIELRRQQEEFRLQQQQQKQRRKKELQQQQREQESQQQQQQEQELRLKMQQQEDELRLRQHERALENDRKKAEEEEEERRMKLELTKGSSRASGSVADEIEKVGSKRNHQRKAGWVESVAQKSALNGHYLQMLLSTLQRMSTRTELTKVSALTRKLPRCSNQAKDFSNATG